MAIPANLDMENSRRAYWLQTITTGGNLSNADLHEAYLKAQAGMPANLSIIDMEKIYWKTKSGSTNVNLSCGDYQNIAFQPYQSNELYWLRAQP